MNDLREHSANPGINEVKEELEESPAKLKAGATFTNSEEPCCKCKCHLKKATTSKTLLSDVKPHVSKEHSPENENDMNYMIMNGINVSF